MRCTNCFKRDSDETPVYEYDVEVVETGRILHLWICRPCAEGEH